MLLGALACSRVYSDGSGSPLLLRYGLSLGGAIGGLQWPLTTDHGSVSILTLGSQGSPLFHSS